MNIILIMVMVIQYRVWTANYGSFVINIDRENEYAWFR